MAKRLQLWLLAARKVGLWDAGWLHNTYLDTFSAFGQSIKHQEAATHEML